MSTTAFRFLRCETYGDVAVLSLHSGHNVSQEGNETLHKKRKKNARNPRLCTFNDWGLVGLWCVGKRGLADRLQGIMDTERNGRLVTSADLFSVAVFSRVSGSRACRCCFKLCVVSIIVMDARAKCKILLGSVFSAIGGGALALVAVLFPLQFAGARGNGKK